MRWYLASVVLRGKMKAETMRDINVHGTQLVFEAARSGYHAPDSSIQRLRMAAAGT